MYRFDLTYVQAWSRPYIRSFDLIYVHVDLIYLTLDLIYQLLTIYLKTDFCPIWQVINISGTPDIDLFASRLNNKQPKYFSWRPDPFCMELTLFLNPGIVNMAMPFLHLIK